MGGNALSKTIIIAMKYPSIYLKKGKEIPIKRRHHWIFSGAISHGAKFADGDICAIYSYSNEFLGHGYCNNKTTIAIRMINYSTEDPLVSLEKNIEKAFQMRINLFSDNNTNAYRLVNGEGDFVPGLIVDRYNNILVLQISTVGIDKLKDKVVEFIKNASNKTGIKIDGVYEKSTMSARSKDGLMPFEGLLYGNLTPNTLIEENGIKFIVNIAESQKTGLFLDQREMRKLIGSYSKGKRVLNCFGYTGGFSFYAKAGNAQSVTTIDISEPAISQCKLNYEANNFSLSNDEFLAIDAFDFLRSNSLNFDIVILDPPAFAKKKTDLEKAVKGYAEINRTSLSKMPAGSILLTCSCSYHLSQEMFEEIVKKAAMDAKREVRIISRQRLAADHPININHKEIDYLKSLLLYVY